MMPPSWFGLLLLVPLLTGKAELRSPAVVASYIYMYSPKHTLNRRLRFSTSLCPFISKVMFALANLSCLFVYFVCTLSF